MRRAGAPDGRPLRMGVFGGTFDPPHVGHLMVAQDVYEALELDRLLLVPSAVPPHRAPGESAAAELRLEMTRAAVAGDGRFEVCDIEFRREGPSWTVETLRELAGRHPEAELHFVMGVDQLQRFHTWREPDEVARLARLVVMTREGDEPAETGGRPDLGDAPGTAEGAAEVPFDAVPVVRIDLSSTMIRRRVAEGRSIRYLVPEGVLRIIEEHRLYLSGDEPPGEGSRRADRPTHEEPGDSITG